MSFSREEIENNIDDFVNEYFENFEFRPYQKEAIIDIIDNFQNKTKSQIISAPTGSGKSLIAIISCGVIYRMFSTKSFIICSDLSLFQQYVDAIQHNNLPFGYIKGTQEYSCFKNNEKLPLAVCRVQNKSFNELVSKETTSGDSEFCDCLAKCPYLKDKFKAIKSPITVMTYQFYLIIKNIDHNPYGEREFVVCDEAHKIPDIIQSKYSLEITDRLIDNLFNIKEYIIMKEDFCDQNFNDWRQKNFKNSKDLKTLLDEYYPSSDSVGIILKSMIEETNNSKILVMLNDLLNSLERYNFYCENFAEHIKSMTEKNSEMSLSHEIKKQYTACRQVLDFIENISLYLSTVNGDSDEIIKQNITSNFSNGVKLNCLHENALCQRYFHNENISEVMLSATFPKIETFRENIGLDEPFINSEEEFFYKEIPSTFNFENSPIFVTDKCRMSYKEKKQNLPKMVSKIIELLEIHNDERGIIQTGSYEFSKALVDALPANVKKRILFYNNTEEKRQVLEKLEKKKNGVLVGPSLLEGLDLKDDLCRFIIVMKVPYASLGDALVSAKCNLIKGWYQADAICKILQGVGRGVRNISDWCVTYILDGCVWELLLYNHKSLPKEFMKRIKTMKDEGWQVDKD